jgi:hypothetical protein
MFWMRLFCSFLVKDAPVGFFHDMAGTSFALVVDKMHGMNLSAFQDVRESCSVPSFKEGINP